MGTYEYEIDHPGNYEKITELFRLNYGHSGPRDFFYNQYATEKLGGKQIGILAIDRKTQKPVSHYCVLPVSLFHSGSVFVAAQSADAVTLEKHRKKGLFTLLAQKVHEISRQNGIKCIFTFPNPNSYPGFTGRLNFHLIHKLFRWDAKLKWKTVPLAKICKRFHYLNFLYLKYCSFILRRYKISQPNSFHCPAEGPFIKVYRNKDYLNYKKSDNKFFIAIGDLKTWIKIDEMLIIGDFSLYSHINKPTISKLKRMSFWMGCNTISFYASETIPLPGDFEDYFTKQNETPVCILSHDELIKSKQFVFTTADFDTW